MRSLPRAHEAAHRIVIVALATAAAASAQKLVVKGSDTLGAKLVPPSATAGQTGTTPSCGRSRHA